MQILLTRFERVFYTLSDLFPAYNQVLLSEDTKQLTSFLFSGKQHMFKREFYGVCAVANFFSRIMTKYFSGMVATKQAISYIDDVILQAKTKFDIWKDLEFYF